MMAMNESSEKMEEVFKHIDTDGDGKISASELGTVVKALEKSSDEEVQTMMEEMDADRDGFVDHKEFADFHRAGGGDKELKGAFDMYDLDHNGVISASELQRVLKQLGDKSSVSDCSKMIGCVDGDGDGSVSFEEFKKMMAAGGKGFAAASLPPTPSDKSS